MGVARAARDAGRRRIAAGLALAALALGGAIAWLPLEWLAIGLAIVAAVAAAAAILAEPMLGAALTLFFAPFGPLTRIQLDTPLDPGQALFGLTLIAWAARRLMAVRDGRAMSVGRVLRHPVTLLLAAFLAAAGVSVLPAQSFELWAKEWVQWAEVPVMLTLVATESDGRKRRLVLGALLASAAWQGAFGVFQFGLRGEGPKEFEILDGRFWRAYGTLEQPNPYGGYLGMLWPVAAGAALSLARGASARSSRWRAIAAALAGVAAALALAGVAASWSRGAWLGAAAAAVALALALFRRPLIGAGAIAVAGAALLGLYAADALPDSVRSRLTDFTAQFSAVDVRGVNVSAANYAVIERLAHWQAGLNMIEAEPWLGVGFGNYAAAYDQHRLFAWRNPLHHAHNYYINTWAETGLFGLAAYGALWVGVVAVSWRAARRPGNRWAALAAGTVGAWAHLSAHNVVDNLYVANTPLMIGALLGLLVAGQFDVRQEKHHASQGRNGE